MSDRAIANLVCFLAIAGIMVWAYWLETRAK